jgi:crossover junction endodeoxyribonuclease RusA
MTAAPLGQAATVVPGLRFVVYGGPKTKGSLKHVGRGILVEDHKSSKPWREAVKWAALEAIAAREGTGEPFAMLSGPVEVLVVFSFPRPKNAGPRVTRPATRSSGDVDKLLRNVFDALGDAYVFADDSQVARVVANKAFVGEGSSRLTSPGAEITVRPLPAGAPA